MKQFSLAGLLRVRHAQQQKALAELSEANRRIRDVAERRARVERTLVDAAGSKSIVTDAATLIAVAAARASTRSMIAELDAVADAHRIEAAEAQSEFNGARARSIALEKLEERHTALALAEELRDEQLALDEIASNNHRPSQFTAREGEQS
ncbi:MULTISPECIES: flagellar FliJ family protein [unclassified Frondihabitans]|uniref:flagellar FliJ family protein n=1 Tax=unclassified Frondihabitans TaxID=2626248 RepID=UPI000FB48581|nr:MULTISPECIES: flagellar FliJ family protein [unclassified Frondihabitans]RPE77510.1 flagellar FliJ protein [Frondihabitans sp. PhB153]RPF07787.1 flagellar FliJ protein [Frondihabitans sp. PhB161]